MAAGNSAVRKSCAKSNVPVKKMLFEVYHIMSITVYWTPTHQQYTTPYFCTACSLLWPEMQEIRKTPVVSKFGFAWMHAISISDSFWLHADLDPALKISTISKLSTYNWPSSLFLRSMSRELNARSSSVKVSSLPMLSQVEKRVEQNSQVQKWQGLLKAGRISPQR
jgi:hypothetical protein